MENKFISGEKINLRTIDVHDAEYYASRLNDPEIRETLFLSLPTTSELEEEKIREYLKSTDTLAFTIVDKNSNKAVGLTAFYRIDYVHSNAVFFLAIMDSDYWSLGFGTEATKSMMEYAFETLNLNRIQLHVYAENKPAIRIYSSVGFKKEGVLRQAMFRSGEYHDFWIMGMLQKEWQRRKRKQRK
ncbi:GNAT family N-acetyltransferase [candidate division KSB1 bacterium]|nr:GNAT family N-acetyltransferase [candidate division KSB1 bacterium]